MSIQTAVEEVLKFLRWVAELIVTKNWFALLGVLIVLICLLLIPPHLHALNIVPGQAGHSGLLLGLFPDELPGWYLPGFVLVQLGLIVSALVVAIRTMPKPDAGTLADVAERKAIKGLRPFSSEDADIFAKLQRTQSLRDCLESITSATFRFGILMGESGCGKTSFLQAGVWPQLRKAEATHAGIYVRFSDQDPIRTIAKAVAEQLEVPLDWLIPSESAHTLAGGGHAAGAQPSYSQQVAPIQFQKLLTQATEATAKPLVLLLDQFEQFFVHYKRQEQRQPFVQALAQWYCREDPLPVKILVSIRSDLMYQLDDLHQALGYALGPQEVVQLKKFTPEEAASILGVIAREEKLAFERRFVVDLADQELANREDGLISPVDLQILAWMIDRQTSTETRAFNRTAFQKFGGVEGLLQRFLERTLQARVTQSQRQSAVKVLLALTDLDRQVRAGVLTAPDLESKLKGTVKPEDVKEAVTWLARSDVRLITPQAQDQAVGYELAHERLIPALMQQAGKELSAADKANQLLDRRVNEWLGNQRQSRYWFGVRELWQIERQLPYLVWGPKRRHKEQLLQLSRRRIYGAVAGVMVVLVIAVGVSGWLLYTPAGQMRQVRTQLWSHVERTNSTFKAAHGALAYAKHGEWPKARTILRKHVARQDKDILWFIQAAARWLPYVEGRSALSQQLSPLAEALENDWSKSEALRAIAAAYIELNDPQTTKILLEKSFIAAENIESDGQKASVLSSIIDTIDTVPAQPLRQDLLGAALRLARTEETSVPMVNIATIYAKQQQWGKALAALKGCRESEKIVGLMQIFTAEAEAGDLRLIKGAVILPTREKGTTVIDDSNRPTFEVTVQSPDEDCEHYADWVEVITPDGALKGRQVFNQPHLNAPTFSEPLSTSEVIQPDEEVIIRAHFHGTYASGEDPLIDSALRERIGEGRYERSGYTDQALRGTVADGFQSVRLSENYAQWLEEEEPLPEWERCGVE
ncbi:MAG: ATP-binding protein [Leptolyngbya sp. SIO1E4]|nr:ATP-binding protein [Leptolyngbya sp. SIO1E4]